MTNDLCIHRPLARPEAGSWGTVIPWRAAITRIAPSWPASVTGPLMSPCLWPLSFRYAISTTASPDYPNLILASPHGAPRLCRNQRRVQPRVLADDAAAIARRDSAVALGEHRRQRPRARRRQPQAQQVALALDLGPVLVSGAGVQDRVIVQELDVARHEVHVEP